MQIAYDQHQIHRITVRYLSIVNGQRDSVNKHSLPIRQWLQQVQSTQYRYFYTFDEKMSYNGCLIFQRFAYI